MQVNSIRESVKKNLKIRHTFNYMIQLNYLSRFICSLYELYETKEFYHSFLD